MGRSKEEISLVLLFFCIAIWCNSAKARPIISNEDDIEIERLLKILNKPALKSIQMENGAIFDCVDIYKQPAFDNPLLKNHQIKMKPTSLPRGIETIFSNSKNLEKNDNKKTCPDGTVLIKRVYKEDLIQDKYIRNVRARRYIHDLQATDDGEAYFAGYGSKGDGLYGAGSLISVYGLNDVKKDQLSSCSIRIWGGKEGGLQSSVQTGWEVNPSTYGNGGTYFFIYWKDGSPKNFKGCSNLLCPGFVQVSKSVTPGVQINDLSVYGGVQRAIQPLIFKDPGDGNWWLTYGADNTLIGYWPKELFTTLKTSAGSIEWGGVVVSPKDLPSPSMGSGHLPSEGRKKSVFFNNVTVVNSKNWLIGPNPGSLAKQNNTDPNVYGVSDVADFGGVIGISFLSGGPGGYKS